MINLHFVKGGTRSTYEYGQGKYEHGRGKHVEFRVGQCLQVNFAADDPVDPDNQPCRGLIPQETCQAREIARCPGCRTECYTLKCSSLVSVEAN